MDVTADYPIVRHKALVLIHIAAISLYVAIVTYAIGYGLPYWFQKSEFPEGISGIWVSCSDVNTTGQYQWQCYDSKDFMVDDWGESWIPGVRALSTMGLVTLVASVVLVSLTIVHMNTEYKMALIFWTMANGVTTFFFAVTVVIIQGVNSYVDQLTDYYLSWSFSLSCLATCMCFIADGLILAVLFLLTRDEAYRRLASSVSTAGRGSAMPGCGTPIPGCGTATSGYGSATPGYATPGCGTAIPGSWSSGGIAATTAGYAGSNQTNGGNDKPGADGGQVNTMQTIQEVTKAQNQKQHTSLNTGETSISGQPWWVARSYDNETYESHANAVNKRSNQRSNRVSNYD